MENGLKQVKMVKKRAHGKNRGEKTSFWLKVAGRGTRRFYLGFSRVATNALFLKSEIDYFVRSGTRRILSSHLACREKPFFDLKPNYHLFKPMIDWEPVPTPFLRPKRRF